MGLKPRSTTNLVDVYLAAIREVYNREGVELDIRSGASVEAIDSYSREVERSPSVALRALWTSANGTGSTLLCRPGFYTGYDLLGLQESLRCRAGMRDRASRYGDYEQPRQRDRRIQAGWYQPGWLPFASFGGDTLVLLEDHSPGTDGCPGQIIGFVHDPDEMVYVASSLPELLERALPQMQSDPFEYGIE